MERMKLHTFPCRTKLEESELHITLFSHHLMPLDEVLQNRCGGTGAVSGSLYRRVAVPLGEHLERLLCLSPHGLQWIIHHVVLVCNGF